MFHISDQCFVFQREALSFDEEGDERDDEEPQVVVLKEGDLTAEEASQAKTEKEEGIFNLWIKCLLVLVSFTYP